VESDCRLLPQAEFRHTTGAILYKVEGQDDSLDGRHGESILSLFQSLQSTDLRYRLAGAPLSCPRRLRGGPPPDLLIVKQINII
jgi:hypothetical protein